MMHTPLKFRCGKMAKNRFVLAPLTNQQSHDDGTLSSEESHWLTARAKGGFGIVMTCAAFVSTDGIGFQGQLGVSSELNSEPHLTLNKKIHAYEALSLVQLYHGGARADDHQGTHRRLLCMRLKSSGGPATAGLTRNYPGYPKRLRAPM